MKKIIIALSAVLAFTGTQSLAQGLDFGNTDYYGTQKQSQSRKYNPDYQQDAWGSHTKQKNLYKDSDGDGVPNYLDYNDRNPNIQHKGQNRYIKQPNIYKNW